MSRQETISLVKKSTDMVVQTGPFAGLRLHDRQTWGGGEDVGPQLLGVYEQELHSAIIEFCAQRPTTVVNIGCAEGYYAVGIARLLPNARVYAFDTDPHAQQVCMINAELNMLADRVYVESSCSPARFAEIAGMDGNILAIIDCEGYEKSLFGDPVVLEALKFGNAVIETHDFIDSAISSELFTALSPSHHISIVRSGARNPHIFSFLDKCPETDKWLLISENRPELMQWLVCQSRHQLPQSQTKGISVGSAMIQRSPQGAAPQQKVDLLRPQHYPYDINSDGLVVARFRPLICTVVFGDDLYFDCLRIMLESLFAFGCYQGEIAVFSDRSVDDVMSYMPDDSAAERTHVIDLTDPSITGRYTIADYDLETYSPILYLDVDILVNKEILPCLEAINGENGICVSTEAELYPNLASSNISEVQDGQRIGNWFGLELLRRDKECHQRSVPCANSGIIGFRHHGQFGLVSYIVRDLYRHPEHVGLAKYFTDQPFLNYALVKTGLGRYDTLKGQCSFLDYADAYYPDTTRYFAHFIWPRGQDKVHCMKRYLKVLKGHLEKT
jgi:hypothetical protein